jgi:hypothetical protein
MQFKKGITKESSNDKQAICAYLRIKKKAREVLFLILKVSVSFQGPTSTSCNTGAETS